MPLDDDSSRQISQLRAREKMLGWALGLLAVMSTLLYVLLLKDKLSPTLLVCLVASEWLAMLFIYLIIVSKMRLRGSVRLCRGDFYNLGNPSCSRATFTA